VKFKKEEREESRKGGRMEGRKERKKQTCIVSGMTFWSHPSPPK
jgi:hypothetical protein